MTPQTFSFETLFNQSNEHLREQDKNRDRLIEFYLVLVGALLAAVTTTRLDPASATILCVVIFLIGMVLAHTVTQYRLWHTRYSYTTMLLEALSRSEDFGATERQMRILAERMLGIRGDRGTKKDQKRGFGDWLRHEICRVPGTEAATFYVSLFVTAVTLYLWIGKLPPFPWASIGIIVLYVLVANLLAAWYLYREHKKCPWAAWLLIGLDLQWDFCEQHKRDW